MWRENWLGWSDWDLSTYSGGACGECKLPIASKYRIIHRNSTKNCIHVEVAVLALSLKVGKRGWKFLVSTTRSPDPTPPIFSQAPSQSLLGVDWITMNSSRVSFVLYERDETNYWLKSGAQLSVGLKGLDWRALICRCESSYIYIKQSVLQDSICLELILDELKGCHVISNWHQSIDLTFQHNKPP